MASKGFDFPSNSASVDERGFALPPWLQWFQRIHDIAIAAQQSGTTAERPTKLLWIGRRFFDTDLGKPIWLQSLGPTVWCDATGASV